MRCHGELDHTIASMKIIASYPTYEGKGVGLNRNSINVSQGKFNLRQIIRENYNFFIINYTSIERLENYPSIERLKGYETEVKHRMDSGKQGYVYNEE